MSRLSEARPAVSPRAWGRFWAKVNKTETCWEWAAAKNPDGYGRFGMGKRLVYPHRLIAAHTYGVIPEGMVVDHLCRNPSCVRPDHLEIVSMRENTVRGDLAEVTRRYQSVKTHCPAGHPYSGDNLYVNPSGQRQCRTCIRASKARYLKRRAAQ